MFLTELEGASVEYKIFGPARWPTDDFKSQVKALAGLSDEQQNALVQWFLSTSNYDLEMSSLPAEIVASPLLPQQFQEAAEVVRTLLDNWQSYELELPEIERDLLLLGCSQEEISVVSKMLISLSAIRERLWIGAREDLQQVLGLPTIADVNIVWNARPVFGGLPYYFWSDTRDEGSYRRFLGLTYLATLEIFSADSDGQKQRTSVQMTESQFRRLFAGMKRASEQLDILKKHTKSIALDTENAEKSE
jgi:hypothetical protein